MTQAGTVECGLRAAACGPVQRMDDLSLPWGGSAAHLDLKVGLCRGRGAEHSARRETEQRSPAALLGGGTADQSNARGSPKMATPRDHSAYATFLLASLGSPCGTVVSWRKNSSLWISCEKLCQAHKKPCDSCLVLFVKTGLLRWNHEKTKIANSWFQTHFEAFMNVLMCI